MSMQLTCTKHAKPDARCMTRTANNSLSGLETSSDRSHDYRYGGLFASLSGSTIPLSYPARHN